MKDNSNLDKIKALAEQLGYTANYVSTPENDYSDRLIIRANNFTVTVHQSHKYDPDAPYGGFTHPYYADIKANKWSHIGMYDFDEVCELLQNCRRDIDEVLNGFISKEE